LGIMMWIRHPTHTHTQAACPERNSRFQIGKNLACLSRVVAMVAEQQE